MTIIPIDIVGGTNPGRYAKISDESTYNMIVSDKSLVPYAGYKSVKKITSEGETRALFKSDIGNFMVAVIGIDIFQITSAITVQRIASLGTSSGAVEITENGNSEIAFSDSVQYYVWNYSTGSFSSYPIGESPGPTPNALAQSLGYIFVSALNSNTFFYSNVNDATVFQTTKNTAEIGSDKIVGMANLNEQIYVFGERHTKIWRDMGLSENPFQLDQTLVIEYGALNKECISTGFGIIAWIGLSSTGNATFMASTGGMPSPISTDAIDFKLSELTKPEDCEGFIFQEDGHVFYQVTFKTDNLTLTYDFTSKMFLYVTDENQDYHIAKDVVHFNNSYYFISFNDTNLYEMSSKYTNYDGKVIPRIRITKPLRNTPYKLFPINELSIVAEQGINKEPTKVLLSISKDGATSFGNYINKNFSNIGNRNHLIRFRKLGVARDWTFQFRFYGTGRVVINDAYAVI